MRSVRCWVRFFGVLTLCCRSVADGTEPAPPPNPRPADASLSGWRPCQTDAECELGQACIAVDPRPEEARLLSVLLKPKACATIVQSVPASETLANFATRHKGRLLLIRKLDFSVTLPICHVVGCVSDNGVPRECCNKCRGEHVVITAQPHVPVFTPDGRAAECKERRDCDAPSCPSWLELARDREIAGTFQDREGQQLAFLLASDPKGWDQGDMR